MNESIFVENMFGVKAYYDLDVLMKTEDEKTIIIKTWNGVLKKLSFNEEEKCYIVEQEM
jgi:hypothetical protein